MAHRTKPHRETTLTKLTTDDLMAAWEAAFSAPTAPPPGWFTSNQLGARFGLKKSATGRRLTELVGAGKCETQRFAIKDSCGRANWVQHYRLKV